MPEPLPVLPIPGWKLAVKRAVDLVASGIGLVLASPLILVGWGLARWSTGAGGFFLHTRIGRGGRPFQLVKLRTMRPDERISTSITTDHDPRITGVGRFLRKTKLDELPQLWNVVRGDMSLVGPRPEVPAYTDRLQGRERMVLAIRPGVTGSATLAYRHEERLLALQDDPVKYNDEVVFPRKIALNLEYIEHYSLLLDIALIMKTLVPFTSSEDVDVAAR